MNTWFRIFLGTLCLALARLVHADAFPSKPLRIIVPFVPGGNSEFLARTLARKMGEGFGQTVVIENMGGAGSTLGTAGAARAAPDGYTTLFGYSSGLTIAPSLYPKLAYDPLISFTPIGTVAQFAMIVTNHASVAAKLSAELARALAAPDLQQFFTGRGYEMFPGTLDGLAEPMRQEVPCWASIVKTADVRLE